MTVVTVVSVDKLGNMTMKTNIDIRPKKSIIKPLIAESRAMADDYASSFAIVKRGIQGLPWTHETVGCFHAGGQEIWGNCLVWITFSGRKVMFRAAMDTAPHHVLLDISASRNCDTDRLSTEDMTVFVNAYAFRLAFDAAKSVLKATPSKTDIERRRYEAEREPISRAHRSRPEDLMSLLNARDMEDLRFRDFAALKVPGGRDQWSMLRIGKLSEAIDDYEVIDSLTEIFPDSRPRASCYRWILRGLEVDRAVRKVKTDLEIGQNAKGLERPATCWKELKERREDEAYMRNST